MDTSLIKEKDYFINYVDSFLDSNKPDIHENIILKRDHSLRVSNFCLDISNDLNLTSDEKELAGIIGLYHDIGRFTQYRDYNTFSDKDSVYHGDLGIQILNSENKSLLYSSKEFKIITTAIHNHGIAKIEPGINTSELLFSQIIRDADKMDIFYIVDAYYKEMLKGKRNIALELGLKNENKISPAIIDSFNKEEIILKSDMNFINDFKLLQIAWMYDLNFDYTKNYVKKSGYIDNIVNQISCTEKIPFIQNKVNSYLNQ